MTVEIIRRERCGNGWYRYKGSQQEAKKADRELAMMAQAKKNDRRK